MCGTGGIINRHGRQSTSVQAMLRLADAQWFGWRWHLDSDDCHVILGHRRLSIFDLSEAIVHRWSTRLASSL